MSQISVNNYVVSKTHVLPPGRTSWIVPSILGYSRTHGLLLSIPGYSTYRGYFPSSQALAQLPITRNGRGSGTFSHVSDVTNRSNYTNMGALGSTTILSWKMAAHKGNLLSLFTRQLGGQRVLQSSLVLLCTGWTLCNMYSRPWAEHLGLLLLNSSACLYCKWWEAGRGSGNEATCIPDIVSTKTPNNLFCVPN